jgi:uncharacterized membrane protein YbhN (UPF0104 family)
MSTDAPAQSGRKAMRIGAALSLAVFALCAWLVLRSVPLAEMQRAFAEMRPTVGGLVIAVIAYLAVVLAHAARVWVLVSALGPVRFVDVLIAHGVSTALNLIFPARTGDIEKARRLSIASGLPFAQCLALCGSDVLFWLIGAGGTALVIGAAAAEIFAPLRYTFLVVGLGGSLGTIGLFLVDVLWARRRPEPQHALARRAWQFSRAFVSVAKPRTLIRVLLLVAVGWTLEVAFVVSVSSCAQLGESWLQAGAAAVAVTLAGAIPAPAGVGPFEAAALFVLERFGHAPGAALAGALFLHGSLVLLPLLVGLVALLAVRRAKER